MNQLAWRVFSGTAMVIVFCFVYFFCHPHVLSLILSAILGSILVFEWPHFFPNSKIIPWLVAPVYPILPFIIIIILNENPQSHQDILSLFGMVGAFDIGSYCVGSLIGRHHIAPRISPGKTWEGFVGGYFAALAFCCLMHTVYVQQYPQWTLMSASIVTLFISVSALMGDLFESWLKRRAGLNDSGSLLPGHGGFLDRFDGILFTGIFLYSVRYFLYYK
jgi:phosphatidate cytidylyltransferase